MTRSVAGVTGDERSRLGAIRVAPFVFCVVAATRRARRKTLYVVVFVWIRVLVLVLRATSRHTEFARVVCHEHLRAAFALAQFCCIVDVRRRIQAAAHALVVVFCCAKLHVLCAARFADKCASGIYFVKLARRLADRSVQIRVRCRACCVALFSGVPLHVWSTGLRLADIGARFCVRFLEVRCVAFGLTSVVLQVRLFWRTG